MRARILDVSIRNPREHFTPLSKHVLSRGVEVGVHLDRNAGAANQRRNRLHDLLVFIQLLTGTELLTGGNQRPNFWVSRNESRIGGLAVYVAHNILYSNRFSGVTTVH